jgi:hypothetical protein
MTNDRLRNPRRVQHHVLAQVDPSIAGRSPCMAISAADLALRDFCEDREPTEGPTHVGNVHPFIPQVVKLKYDRIGLAAIHARVQSEVLPNSLLVLRERQCGC